MPDFHVAFRILLHAEGRRAEDFFALKNPTASAGFEPANLGTKGQHVISRPQKPLSTVFNSYLNIMEINVLLHALKWKENVATNTGKEGRRKEVEIQRQKQMKHIKGI